MNIKKTHENGSDHNDGGNSNGRNKKSTDLSVLAVGVTATQFDWEKYTDKEWTLILPDPSSLSISECMSILNVRDELDDLRQQLCDTDNANLWRYEVIESDEKNKEDFRPLFDLYFDIPTRQGLPTPAVMQQMLRHLPVAVVDVNGEVKLTITQELLDPPMFLCWSYIILGYLPPFSTIEVPDTLGEIDPYLLKVCNKTIELFECRCALKREMIDRLSFKLHASRSFIDD